MAKDIIEKNQNNIESAHEAIRKVLTESCKGAGFETVPTYLRGRGIYSSSKVGSLTEADHASIDIHEVIGDTKKRIAMVHVSQRPEVTPRVFVAEPKYFRLAKKIARALGTLRKSSYMSIGLGPGTMEFYSPNHGPDESSRTSRPEKARPALRSANKSNRTE